MVQYIADRRDIDFVLHEQLQVETLSEDAQYAEFNKKTIDFRFYSICPREVTHRCRE